MSLLERTKTSADAAGREKEPVHEDPFAIIIRIVRKQTMPFVLLLAVALPVALLGLNSPAMTRKKNQDSEIHNIVKIINTFRCSM